MNYLSETRVDSYSQQAIRAKCFHPSGNFIEFEREEIEQSIPQRFEKIVRQDPDRVAIQGDDHRLTYEQLNCLANRVAHVLLDRLGGNETPVALLLRHGISAVVAL